MDAEDWLLLVGAAIAGFYIYKGVGNLGSLISQAPELAYVDAANVAYGISNMAGFSNTTAVKNEWGAGVGVFTSDEPAVIFKPDVPYQNQWGEGYGVFSAPVQTGRDWIAGVHLW